LRTDLVLCRANGIEFAVNAKEISAIDMGRPEFPYAGDERPVNEGKALWVEELVVVVDSVEISGAALEVLAAPKIFSRLAIVLHGFLVSGETLIPILGLRSLVEWKMSHA
jgi:hypothetical protein